jgi:hypothetical protein
MTRSNANYQFAYAKATADKLEIGNIVIGNNSTMATFTKMFARAEVGTFLLWGVAGCGDYVV